MHVSSDPRRPGIWMHWTSHSSSVTWARKPHTLLPLNLRPTPPSSGQAAPAVMIWCRVLFAIGVSRFKNIKVVAQSRWFQFYEWGPGRGGKKRGRPVLDKHRVQMEERPTATSGSVMEVHWRNSCLGNKTLQQSAWRGLFSEEKYVTWPSKVRIWAPQKVISQLIIEMVQ